MPVLFEGDCLVILIAIAAVSLPLKMPRLHNPFIARRNRRLALLEARTNRLIEQAESDAIRARILIRAEYQERLERLEKLPLRYEPLETCLEEFYAQL